MLTHALSVQGIQSLEDAADCATLLIYHKGIQSQHISGQMWNLFPQMIFLITGNDNESSGTGIDNINRMAITFQNFISRDPQTFMSQVPGLDQTYLEMSITMIQKILFISR